MDNLTASAIILFVRNPVLGKVKTRLAKSIGDGKALEVYKFLLAYTYHLTAPLPCTKFVFYAEQIEENDLWSAPGFVKKVQCGDDLGKKMCNAFVQVFEAGYKNVMIIGSDCYQLKVEILLMGFEKLQTQDSVIGPTYDGGYYLLGMNKLVPEVFNYKSWSTNTVFNDTINDFEKINLRYSTLPMLYDIDEEEDLFKSGIDLNFNLTTPYIF